MIPEDKITGIYFIIDELLGYGMSRYLYEKRAFSFQKMLLLKKIIPKKRRLPTLPQYSSTIGVTRLNFSVRNGKRWIPRAITTLIS